MFLHNTPVYLHIKHTFTDIPSLFSLGKFHVLGKLGGRDDDHVGQVVGPIFFDLYFLRESIGE